MPIGSIINQLVTKTVSKTDGEVKDLSKEPSTW